MDDSVILMPGLMFDFESLSFPVPAVEKSDMTRVWELTSELPERSHPGALSFDIRLIRQHCSQGADPVAIWARVSLLRLLLATGLLD